MGRKGIKLKDSDEVLIGLPINRKNEEKYLIAGSDKGNVVKIKIDDFNKQRLNGIGVKYIKLAAGDIVVNGIICTNDDNVLVVGNSNIKAISASEIVQTARDSAGRAVVKDEHIKDLIKI